MNKLELKKKIDMRNVLINQLKTSRRRPEHLTQPLDNAMKMEKASTSVHSKKIGASPPEELKESTSLTSGPGKKILKPLITLPGGDVSGDFSGTLTVRLKPHQKQALAWMMWREQQTPRGGLLGILE